MLDPSGGAATATRDLLELLAAAGWTAAPFCGGLLDAQRPTPPEAVLEGMAIPWRRAQAALPGGGGAGVLDAESAGVRVTLMPFASSRAEAAPTRSEGAAWLALAETILDRFRPDVLLTYGGHPASLELIRRAAARGVPVVFYLHNFAYDDPAVFAPCAGVLVPSEYARRQLRAGPGPGGDGDPCPRSGRVASWPPTRSRPTPRS